MNRKLAEIERVAEWVMQRQERIDVLQEMSLTDKRRIGRLVKELREEVGLSRDEVADRVGLPLSYVASIEAPHGTGGSNPTSAVLVAAELAKLTSP